MGSGLRDRHPDAFVEASTVVGFDIAALCDSGRCESATLDCTRWAQPAIVLVSALSALDHGDAFCAAAGHSVGEYSALVHVGSLTLRDALWLVLQRSDAMERATAECPGRMASVLGLDRQLVWSICSRTGASIAAENAPGHVVVTGPNASVEEVTRLSAEAGAKVRMLKVSGPFHSSAMRLAVPSLTRALDAVDIKRPRLPFWSSTRARVLDDPSAIRASLIDQLTEPVEWAATIRGMRNSGVADFHDAGPGNVLAGLVKRILREEVRDGAPVAGGTR